MRALFAFSLFCGLSGCSVDNHTEGTAWDTAKIITGLNIKEAGARLDLVNEDISNLNPKIDTLELTYYFAFCDCQRWIISSIHNRALAEHPDLDEADPRGQVEFNLQKHGYYIEPAVKELETDWRLGVNGTTIQFIGRLYDDERLPEDGGFTVPNPPKGRVLRYYSYSVIRPYKIWGPHLFRGEFQENGDSLLEPTILTVE